MTYFELYIVSAGSVITKYPPVGIGFLVNVIENRALKIALIKSLLLDTLVIVTIFVVKLGVAIIPVVS